MKITIEKTDGTTETLEDVFGLISVRETDNGENFTSRTTLEKLTKHGDNYDWIAKSLFAKEVLINLVECTSNVFWNDLDKETQNKLEAQFDDHIEKMAETIKTVLETK